MVRIDKYIKTKMIKLLLRKMVSAGTTVFSGGEKKAHISV